MKGLLSLIGDRAAVRRYGWWSLAAVVVRAAVLLVLIPLLGNLFSATPAAALPWLAALVTLVAASWLAEQRFVAAGFTIGFDLLTGVERRLRRRLEQVPVGWFDDTRRSEVQATLASVGKEMCQSVAYIVSPAISSIGSAFLVGVGLLFVNPWLGAAALACWLVSAAAYWLSGRLLRDADRAFARSSHEVGARIVELARSQRVLRANGRAGASVGALGTALGKHQRATLRLLGWSVPGTIVFGVVHQLSLLAVAVVTVRLFLDGAITPGEAVALIVVLVRFLEPFVTLSELAPAVELFRQALGRIRLLLDAEVLPEPVASPASSAAAAAAVELRGVRFGYRPGQPVLDGVDLVVPAGTTTAIVGPSGSGKSTLLDLITRTADVDDGAILVDGVDVRDLRLDDLLGRVAMVHQDVFLHDGTIDENVRDGRPDADAAAVRAAAAAAQLDEVAARLPDGWDTRVGEGGDRLSGGERQRVSIARAILRGAPLLLLDEATSALDVRTEQALVAALAEHTAATTTTVVVAHRLSTIASADQIVFLDGGRVVEQGTLAELLAADGRFAAYWRLRERAGDWVLA